MGNKNFTVVFILALILVTLSNSIFVVHETQRAIVLRLGEMITDNDSSLPKIYKPGLRFKMPFVDQVKFLDARLNTLEIKSSEIPTAEKKNVLVNLYVKWKVKEFGKFYVRTNAGQGWRSALDRIGMLLRQKTIDGVRSEIGRRTIQEVVSKERHAVMSRIYDDVSLAAKELGIEVIDIRIKRIDLPDDVSEAIYNLMRTERQKEAAAHRASGRSEAEKIMSKADSDRIVILAEATKDSKTIRGVGDALAAKIYAESFSKNKEFYSFTKSLEVYDKSFDADKDVMVIKPDGALFEYFKGSDPMKK